MKSGRLLVLACLAAFAAGALASVNSPAPAVDQSVSCPAMAPDLVNQAEAPAIDLAVVADQVASSRKVATVAPAQFVPADPKAQRGTRWGAQLLVASMPRQRSALPS